MKRSLESILNKLIAKVELAPLYDPVPLEPGDSEVAPKGGGGNGGRGTEACGYSRVGFNDYSYMWGNNDGGRNPRGSSNFPYWECPICTGSAPPAICACISAYYNPCYNWHWSNGKGGLNRDNTWPTWDPPAYSSYPPGCPSAQELEGPGYTEEEWIGDPETLSGQRYRWFAWDYLTRIRNPDGSWTLGQLSPLDDSITGFHGSENPLDPDSYSSIIDRVTMRQVWAEFFRGGYGGYRPNLLQRKILESGCRGNPGDQTGACCSPDGEFGGFRCSQTYGPQCQGTFHSGKTCADIGGDNCGSAMNPIQQNDQTKKTKEAMDMVMSLLKRK